MNAGSAFTKVADRASCKKSYPRGRIFARSKEISAHEPLMDFSLMRFKLKLVASQLASPGKTVTQGNSFRSAAFVWVLGRPPSCGIAPANIGMCGCNRPARPTYCL